MRSAELSVEEELQDEALRQKEAAQAAADAEKAAFLKRIQMAGSEDERKDLIGQSKQNEQRIQNQLDNELLTQQRLLEEKRAARRKNLKIKELKIDDKHQGDESKKELDILSKRFQK